MIIKKILNLVQNWRIWFSLLGLAMLVSCSSLDSSKRAIKLDLHIDAAEPINSDASGRSSPIQVWIYELKAVNGFNNLDYFSLTQAEGKSPIEADILVKDEFILRPGDKQTISRDINPDTKFIGVIAGYRDLTRSVWRTNVQMPYEKDPKKRRYTRRVEYDIKLNGNKVQLIEVEKKTFLFF